MNTDCNSSLKWHIIEIPTPTAAFASMPDPSVYKTLEKLETVFSAVKWFISTIVSTFSVMPGWMEAMLMQTSLGRHGQPCMFEMASHETWSCDISLVDFDILKIIKKIPWFSGPTIDELCHCFSIERHGQPHRPTSGMASNETGSIVISHWFIVTISRMIIQMFSRLPSSVDALLYSGIIT